MTKKCDNPRCDKILTRAPLCPKCYNVLYMRARRAERRLKNPPRNKICLQDDCEKPFYAMGMCQRHYDALAHTRRKIREWQG